MVEMTIVLSTGEYLTVNRHQYPDLFWALLGGGGGTYGILTSVTYRTYPSLPVAAAVMAIKTVSANTTQALFTEFLRMTPQLSDAGWAGYGRVTNNHLSLLGIAPNVSATIASKSVQAFFQYGRYRQPTDLCLAVSFMVCLAYPVLHQRHAKRGGSSDWVEVVAARGVGIKVSGTL